MSTDTRIESLETQVRTLKRMLFGVLGVVIVGGLLAATSLQRVPDVVKAKSFEVVNDEGKVFVLISGSTTQPNSIKSRQEGGLISTHNSQGETLILMGMNNHGSGAIQTMNNKGHTLVSLSTNLAGEGTLITENGTGEVTSNTPARSDDLCCQHPHHLECIVNTTSSLPGSCHHSHHLECGVTTAE